MSESSIEASLVEVAIQQLKRKPFVAEYNRRPVGEKQEFMMANHGRSIEISGTSEG